MQSCRAFKSVTNCCLISVEILSPNETFIINLLLLSASLSKIMASKTTFFLPSSKIRAEMWQEFTQIAWAVATMCFEKPFLPLIIYCNGCHMTFLSCKNPVSPFITLNHFLQISQDYIYWIHLSFSCWSCGQRRIASPTRFKDFLRPAPQDWRSFILLTSNHISNLWTHVTYKYATRQNTHFFILLTVFMVTPLLWCLLCLRRACRTKWATACGSQWPWRHHIHCVTQFVVFWTFANVSEYAPVN